MEAKRQLISLYLDKVLVFDDYVEVYLNALPLYIREKLIKKYRNPSENTQIAEISGRGDRIWTCGPYVPNVVLYQTEPHLVTTLYIISHFALFVKGKYR